MATELIKRRAYLGRDTGAAKLPGLPAVRTGNASLDAWLRAATERLEVREGSRGNAAEKVVTQRDLQEISLVVDALKDDKQPGIGEVKLELGGGLTATLAIQRFEDLIRATKLYQDLKRRLDDPSRFDALPEAVREYVRRRLSDEAAERGTAITRIEKIINERYTQMAIRVDTLTSTVDQSSAGLRETMWAVSEANFAQAGKITQLEASLGNFYQDGTPGRALLEEQMTVTADRLNGLDAQYTIKVQAGQYIAGIGLAANENTDGTGGSAMIIAADKFAIVNPLTYSGGLTNTPDAAHVPFGVDANGIYLNHNVYVKGQMRVDTTGKTLLDGLRGSVSVDVGTGGWSDTSARNAVWTKLGKTGTPPNNNHLVIGDQVRIGNTVRMWDGSAWTDPGVVINGSMVVDGSIAAQKINTNGLDIRDAWGNVIFSAGVNLDMSRVAGLGTLASKNTAEITNSASTSMVTVNGVKLKTTDFVHALSKINNSNISTFMENAAIGNAYIGNAAVDTLKIAGGAVTSPVGGRFTTYGFEHSAGGGSLDFVTLYYDGAHLAHNETRILVIASVYVYVEAKSSGSNIRLAFGTAQHAEYRTVALPALYGATVFTFTGVFKHSAALPYAYVGLSIGGDATARLSFDASLSAMAAKR
jgi:hypothetical protein